MDPFGTLGIAQRFDVDLPALERTHRELSRALHPDRYAASGASERRAALEKAVQVNEAWRIVRDPIRRAEALFELAGIPVGETNEPRPTPAFLAEIMEQRELLADARAAKDAGAVLDLAIGVQERARDAEARLSSGFAEGEGKASAALVRVLGELRFYRRFLEEVSAIEDELCHAS